MNQRCRSEARAYFKFLEESRRDHVCWAVFGVSYDINTTPEPAYDEFRRRTGEVGRPNIAASVIASVAQDDEYVFVRYEFNPARWGIEDDARPRAQNGWDKANLPQYPDRQRILQMLTDQGQALADAIKRGLKGRDPAFAWKLDSL
jgi:hypothetical protein